MTKDKNKLTSIDIVIELAKYLQDSATYDLDVLTLQLQPDFPDKYVEALWQRHQGYSYSSDKLTIECIVLLLHASELSLNRRAELTNALSESIGLTLGYQYCQAILATAKLHEVTDDLTKFYDNVYK